MVQSINCLQFNPSLVGVCNMNPVFLFVLVYIGHISLHEHAHLMFAGFVKVFIVIGRITIKTPLNQAPAILYPGESWLVDRSG